MCLKQRLAHGEGSITTSYHTDSYSVCPGSEASIICLVSGEPEFEAGSLAPKPPLGSAPGQDGKIT